MAIFYRQVTSITLPSIAKLREFTNTTLIDVLFYTSPLYLQVGLQVHVSALLLVTCRL